MHTVTLSETQLYELADAANETLMRMLREGQTREEIRYRSLAVLWSAMKAMTEAMHGTADTPGMQNIEPEVLAAIKRPKRKKA
ncbi:hypothetical protein AA919_004259 [Escherichia coli]|nr:hypothetical protein [Escherichia coli]